ncbi:MAG: tetratricopeptide repeat protein [Chloroflexota bacterium]
MASRVGDAVVVKQKATKRAIDLAMAGNWREAVATNKSLLESFADDVDAYNRLGRAYLELGEYEEAREAYSQALRIDPYNVIARKNLSRLSQLVGVAVASEDVYHRVDPHSFIEETGKAGVVSLQHLASGSVLAGLVAGDKVELEVDGLNLAVRSGRGDYVGVVEPRHAHRLLRLLNGGNRYVASVVSVTDKVVSIIIRETYQHPAQAGSLSFPPKGFGRIRPYVSDRLLRRGLDFEEMGEEEEEEYAGVTGGDEMDAIPDDGNDEDKMDGEY